MNKIFIALIRIYQQSIGLFMPGRCRFYPTCSAYAIECFESFGFWKALFKSGWRILRCNPLSEGYEDPVHPHKHRNSYEARQP